MIVIQSWQATADSIYRQSNKKSHNNIVAQFFASSHSIVYEVEPVK